MLLFLPLAVLGMPTTDTDTVKADDKYLMPHKRESVLQFACCYQKHVDGQQSSVSKSFDKDLQSDISCTTVKEMDSAYWGSLSETECVGWGQFCDIESNPDDPINDHKILPKCCVCDEPLTGSFETFQCEEKQCRYPSGKGRIHPKCKPKVETPIVVPSGVSAATDADPPAPENGQDAPSGGAVRRKVVLVAADAHLPALEKPSDRVIQGKKKGLFVSMCGYFCCRSRY